MLFLGYSSGVVASAVSRNGRVWLGGVRTLKSPAYRKMLAKKARGAAVDHKPTLFVAKTMRYGMSELDNESLVSLAAMKNHKARIEVLKRHIMSVDNVNYDTACATYEEIQASNHKGMKMAAFPYLTGMTVATTAGFGCLPLCFFYPSVSAFNEKYVTFDVPEAKDLETWLEVGSWACKYWICLVGFEDYCPCSHPNSCKC